MDNLPTPEERRELAELIGVQPVSLHQFLTGFRQMEPSKAVAAEVATGGRLKRWQLRTKDWHLIWPDLIGAEGAPDIQAETDKA